VVRGSAAAEGIRDEDNGYLCEDDAADLARVIDGALSDPEKLEAVGQRAHDTIPIPWTILVDQVLENYERLIGTAGHPVRAGARGRAVTVRP